jgi:preprotein translocase subunit SecG
VSLYLNIIQIIISVALVIIILLQVKGDTGGVFGGAGVARTRRGLERTMFNATIILAAAFLVISLFSAIFPGS